VYLVVAPIAAMCSAAFPRAVDLNSIGRGSNAHGAAGLIGMISFIAAGAPPLLLTMLATRFLDRPQFMLLLLLGWCLISYVIGRLLFIPARRLFAARRENLAMID
jgi:H+/Cl- antiporter ClcA